LYRKCVKLVLVVEYDGTNYCGFQYQVKVPTVQGEIEKAIFQLTGENVRVSGASRTDTGVHALEQVVSFRTNSNILKERIIAGLNHYLPQDVAVKVAYKVSDSFNIQTQAVSREYNYYIHNREVRSPLKNGFTYQVKRTLEIGAMNRAARLLIGEHDMGSFVTDFSHSNIKHSVRKVFVAQVERQGDEVVFKIIARSFLPHQVRNTVGTLIRVGLGKLSLSEFESILEAKQPGLAGPTVPARGLLLTKVNYPRPLGEYDEDL
jgi:tRNA pseudouridine38-40 synthase